MLINCAYCGKERELWTGHVNRAKKGGYSLYCGRKCSGLGRRKNKTDEQKIEEKRIYDAGYRKKNIKRITRNKALAFQESYNPIKAAKERKKAKEERPHVEAKRIEYMRSKKYKGNKKKYDRLYRAIKSYGQEWGECMALTLDLRDECLNQASDYEIRMAAGTLSKTQKRRRDYDRLISDKLEDSPLGNT